MSELVTFTRDGEIGIITVVNPPVNALSPGVPEGIAEAIEQVNVVTNAFTAEQGMAGGAACAVTCRCAGTLSISVMGPRAPIVDERER